MATFPTGIADALHSPSTNDTIAATDVSNLVTEILSIEAKVGANSSAVTTSHDYLLTHLPAQASDIDWDAGAIKITAENFTSDIATGTRPLIVTSTTVCTNLNADMCDGKHVAGTNGAGEITTNDGTQTLTGKTLTSPTINTPTISGGAWTGGTDLAVADGGTGSSTAADARTALGLGSMATQANTAVNIDGGTIDGITDLAVADGGTGASTAGDARTNLGLGTIATQAATAVNIDGGTIDGITDLAVADGGTGSSTAANTANGVVILGADGYLPNASCDTTALKTSIISEVSTAGGNMTLPGGEYGFYPQIKCSVSGARIQAAIAGTLPDMPGVDATSYVTNICMRDSSGGATLYAQQRYVTASGEDLWLFLLLDKTTKEIVSSWIAEDHPAYGNGGDFDKVPHPFGSYDEATQEIVIIDKETCLALKAESEATGKSMLTLVNEDMKIDYATEKVYEPLHSGKFLTEDKEGKQVQVKEMVTQIAPYIKVKGLQLLTQTDKEVREAKHQQATQKQEQDKQKKAQDKLSTKNKLKVLGLSDDEINALL